MLSTIGPLNTANEPSLSPAFTFSTSALTSSGTKSAILTKSFMPSFVPHFVTSVFHVLFSTSLTDFS